MHFWQKQQLTIVIIAVVVMVWFVLVAYLPLRQGKMQTEEAALEHSTHQMRTDSELKQLPQLKTQLKQIERAVANYEAQVPSTTQLGTFLQQMAEVMNTYNLKGHLIEPGDEVTTKKLNSIPVNIKCTGNLRQIFEFFKSLEKFDRAIRIEKVQLRNDKDFTGEVKMHTKLYVYCTPENERAI